MEIPERFQCVMTFEGLQNKVKIVLNTNSNLATFYMTIDGEIWVPMVKDYAFIDAAKRAEVDDMIGSPNNAKLMMNIRNQLNYAVKLITDAYPRLNDKPSE